MTQISPVILIILDGFGHGEATPDNAIAQARKPNLDKLLATCPHTLINASESFVGLPSGQMGNSEVGHLNIGAGRIVAQEFDRINIAIENGEFNRNPVLLEAVEKVKNKALHIFGLLSDGGIHSHQEHIFAMLRMVAKAGINKLYVHAFLDGRDTPPQSAKGYLAALEEVLQEIGVGRIASVTGRFYAMDRDKRWERVAPAYKLVTDGVGEFSATDAQSALQAAYARGENDEFVKPTSIGEAVRIEDSDVVIYMNFRSDRARELSQAFLDADFDGFPRNRVPKLGGYYTLTQYSQSLAVTGVAFAPYAVRNGFGEYIAGLGLKQLRIAETEKYPHVTFFFNGGEETVYAGEERILVPSPKVATYDLQPEMHAPEVTDKLVEAILSRKYDAIICNYANADMVGHTGNLQAAIKAIETLDTCVGRVVNAMQQIGGEVIITADHGNAEAMRDHIHHQAHTQHTTNLVPFIYVGRMASIAKTGALQDIAPTLLQMMGVPQPTEMTGKSLVTFES
ncbi:MAG: 2,3-bisphosphoglycerate-independent phosphoglycerate mutase [Methylophilales bacterium]|nr:2,3-bisphosphoglycerate-independent phosphoglycerate mutase [Methylophilales bacterium]